MPGPIDVSDFNKSDMNNAGAGSATGVYDVQRTFQAAGNGAIDDTARIQAAIDVAGSNGGGTVWLGPGQYRITAPLLLNQPSVHLRGPNTGFWYNQGTCTILMDSALTGAAVEITGKYGSVIGIAFAPKSGTTSVPIITIAGSSGSHVGGTRVSDVYATNTGGIVTNYADGLKFENVNLQNWNGSAGFNISNGGIVYLTDCNSAPSGTGTVSSWTYGYQIANCETVVTFGCEVNNTPYYGLYSSGTSDSKWYDFEFNGAVLEQAHFEGGNDNQVHNAYIFQPAPIGLRAHATSLLQVDGGWVGDAATIGVEIDTCANCQVSNLIVYPPSGANGITITDDGSGPTRNVQVSGCNVTGNGMATGISILGSNGGSGVVLANNIVRDTTGGTIGIYCSWTYGMDQMSISGGLVEGVTTGLSFSSVNFINQSSLVEGVVFASGLTTRIFWTGISGFVPWVRNCVGVDLNFPVQHTSSVTIGIPDVVSGHVEGNSASAITFTLPASPGTPLPTGTTFNVYQIGAGAVTIAGASGVTVTGPSLTTVTQGRLTCRLRSTNAWIVN